MPNSSPYGDAEVRRVAGALHDEMCGLNCPGHGIMQAANDERYRRAAETALKAIKGTPKPPADTSWIRTPDEPPGRPSRPPFRDWLRRRAVFLYGWLCMIAGWVIAGLIGELGHFGASMVLGIVALTVLTLAIARVADWLEVRRP